MSVALTKADSSGFTLAIVCELEDCLGVSSLPTFPRVVQDTSIQSYYTQTLWLVERCR